jgi:tetratricopeptide (TPR) repeat protein
MPGLTGRLRRSITRRFAIAVSCGSLLLASPVAYAQSPDDPEELRRRGNEFVDNGRAAEAIELYQRAYEQSKMPALLYNLGRAHMSLGDYATALGELERFKEVAPPDLLQKVPSLGATLVELRAKVAKIHVVCNESGATVRLRDRTVGQTPIVDFQVNAGEAHVEIRKDGFLPFEARVLLRAAETETLDVVLSPVPQVPKVVVAAPNPTPDQSKGSRTAGYILAGSGGALLLTSGVFAGLTLQASEDAKCAAPCYTTLGPAGPNPVYDNAVAAHERSVTLSYVSTAAFALGVVAIATGAYLILRKPNARERALSSPWVTSF